MKIGGEGSGNVTEEYSCLFFPISYWSISFLFLSFLNHCTSGSFECINAFFLFFILVLSVLKDALGMKNFRFPTLELGKGKFCVSYRCKRFAFSYKTLSGY